MLDEFFSDDPDDYLAGFPSHPHRGFETVTYMLDGHMQHQDHLGNQGDLGPGDVQWMTAARGIIHSEMPQQTEGRMRGFQLWLNLPAAEKMKPASYQDIPSSRIPEAEFSGGKVRVIAGQYVAGEQRVDGAVSSDLTQPIYLDIHLQAGARFEATLPPEHNAFVYAYEGQPTIADEELPHRAAGLLTHGDTFEVEAEKTHARLLLLAGRPIGEPIAQYGPFVMNTREEIEQAVADYRDGTLTA
jgi:redox-sensitive bicupin YhaK (pirin superfamily)